MQSARELSAAGIKVMRAGIWKPRTKPGGFEGVGAAGLSWLKSAKEETGILVSTEVATEKHVYEALKYGIDLLWTGARTTANPFAMQEIADALSGVDIPVLVKNPVNPDLDLWIGALERINNAGIRQLGAIHRGFSTFEKKIFRNAPKWHIPIELKRRYPALPIFCDPSHISGKSEYILPVAQQAMDLNFEGLIIESHPNPQCAWSDALQQVTPQDLQDILARLVIRNGKQTTVDLQELRAKIDELDSRLLSILATRMRVSRDIGIFKKEHNMLIVQNERYSEILAGRIEQAAELGMDPEFMRTLLEAIHEESIRHQMEVMNQK
jgi:chorismate mutase